MVAKTAVANVLRADATLMALLTGGVYTVAQIAPGMDAPTPFDAVGRVRPSALVRGEVAAADGPRGRFERAFVLVFLYDYAGYETINDALERVKALLHERLLGNSGYEVRHTGDVTDQYDDALLAFMHRSRFQIMRMRGETE